MTYRLWQLAWVLDTLVIASIPVNTLLAIWTADPGDRFANTAFFTFIAAAMTTFALGMWSDLYRPDKPLPRAVRKQIRKKEEEMVLDREIKRLERENGVSHDSSW